MCWCMGFSTKPVSPYLNLPNFPGDKHLHQMHLEETRPTRHTRQSLVVPQIGPGARSQQECNASWVGPCSGQCQGSVPLPILCVGVGSCPQNGLEALCIACKGGELKQAGHSFCCIFDKTYQLPTLPRQPLGPGLFLDFRVNLSKDFSFLQLHNECFKRH